MLPTDQKKKTTILRANRLAGLGVGGYLLIYLKRNEFRNDLTLFHLVERV